MKTKLFNVILLTFLPFIYGCKRDLDLILKKPNKLYQVSPEEYFVYENWTKTNIINIEIQYMAVSEENYRGFTNWQATRK